MAISILLRTSEGKKQIRRAFADILVSMKSVKSKLVKDTEDEVIEKTNDRVDPGVQYQADEKIWRPLEEKIDPIVGELETPKKDERK